MSWKLSAGRKKSADVDERSFGGLAGTVHSRYPGGGWGRCGGVTSRHVTSRHVTSHSRTPRTVQNAAGTGVSCVLVCEEGNDL
jgi:hypothetical protein